ncbi:hypothetical protein LCGC14_1122610 [marine sediment metagenome]|uniref:Uncharacterized protein n=1 Tax=marine sediment metagenome TaxID=412755 RepID=A0A0F9MRE0_9ZZZZ
MLTTISLIVAALSIGYLIGQWYGKRKYSTMLLECHNIMKTQMKLNQLVAGHLKLNTWLYMSPSDRMMMFVELGISEDSIGNNPEHLKKLFQKLGLTDEEITIHFEYTEENK